MKATSEASVRAPAGESWESSETAWVSSPGRLDGGTCWRALIGVAYGLLVASVIADILLVTSVLGGITRATGIVPFATMVLIIVLAGYEFVYKRNIVRRRLAARDGLVCPNCGYDLRTGLSDRCPECGRRSDADGLRWYWAAFHETVAGFHWRLAAGLWRHGRLVPLTAGVAIAAGAVPLGWMVLTGEPAIGSTGPPYALLFGGLALVPAAMWAENLVHQARLKRLVADSPCVCPCCLRLMAASSSRLSCSDCLCKFEGDELARLWATVFDD